MDIATNMIKSLQDSGCSDIEIKAKVIETLSPFFIHSNNLEEHWNNAQLLSAFAFISRYKGDDDFSNSINEFLGIYRSAVSQNPEKVIQIILDSHDVFSANENQMWAIKKDIANLGTGDLDERIAGYMGYIGTTLEVSVKAIVCEIWFMIQLSEGKKFENGLPKLNFGSAIYNILNKQVFTDLLVTYPLSAKLSDWRNIAYHHTYQIDDREQIKCIYANGAASFSLTEQELLHHLHNIVRASNILNIARCLFAFDYIDEIGRIKRCRKDNPIRFNRSMLANNLKTSMLSQGFQLREFHEQSDSITCDITDLRNNGNLSDADIAIRLSSCTSYLFQVWYMYKKSHIQIDYYISGNQIPSHSICCSENDFILQGKDIVEFADEDNSIILIFDD